jgi:hypothetical protein
MEKNECLFSDIPWIEQVNFDEMMIMSVLYGSNTLSWKVLYNLALRRV